MTEAYLIPGMQRQVSIREGMGEEGYYVTVFEPSGHAGGIMSWVECEPAEYFILEEEARARANQRWTELIAERDKAPF